MPGSPPRPGAHDQPRPLGHQGLSSSFERTTAARATEHTLRPGSEAWARREPKPDAQTSSLGDGTPKGTRATADIPQSPGPRAWHAKPHAQGPSPPRPINAHRGPPSAGRPGEPRAQETASRGQGSGRTRPLQQRRPRHGPRDGKGPGSGPAGRHREESRRRGRTRVPGCADGGLRVTARSGAHDHRGGHGQRCRRRLSGLTAPGTRGARSPRTSHLPRATPRRGENTDRPSRAGLLLSNTRRCKAREERRRAQGPWSRAAR